MIGEYIKKQRKLIGMNQSQLAEALKLKQSTIANYEKNVRTPNIEVLVNMAEYFGVTVDEMLGREKIDYSDNIDLSDQFLNYLLCDDIRRAESLAAHYLEETSLKSLYFKLFRYALTKLGWLWEVGEITISKEHQISYIISRMITNFGINRSETSEIKIFGMASPGEKHNIGLKMLMFLLEKEGYDTLYLNEAVPDEDLIRHLEFEKYQYLVLSITNALHKSHLMRLVESLPNIHIYIVGSGAINIQPSNNILGVYTTYESCLEAILCQIKN